MRLNYVLKCVILASGFTLCSQAATVTFGSQTFSAIGDEIGSEWDKLAITGNPALSIDPANPSTQFVIGTFEFTVGGNCNVCGPKPGTFVLPVTVDGGAPQNLVFPYLWSSTGATDQVQVQKTNTLTFALGTGQLLHITSLAFETGMNGGAGPTLGTIYGTATPEPATLFLIGGGLVAGGLLRRRTLRS